MNNAMLDVTIGLALLYSVLSLLVTITQEFLTQSRPFKWRSRYLRKTVRSAFGESSELTEKFFAHPLVVSLQKGDGSREPSYIPPELFAKVFLSVLGNGTPPMQLADLTPTAWLQTLVARPAAAAGTSGGRFDIAQALGTLTGGDGTDWTAFERSVGQWFYEIGERSRGWYKRSSQTWAFVLALALAVGLNIDSVLIARTLWDDAGLRAELVALAQTATAASAGASAAGTGANRAEAKPTRAERFAGIDDSLRELLELTGSDRYVRDDELMRLACRAPAATVAAGTAASPAAGAPRCNLDCPTGTPAPKAQAASCARKLYPALLWPDDIARLRRRLAQIGDAASEIAAANAQTASKPNWDDVQQTLRALRDEVRQAQFALAPAQKSNALLADLARRVAAIDDAFATLRAEALERPAAEPVRRRAQLECAAANPGDAAAQARCTASRTAGPSAGRLFGLPIGYGDEVLARQASDAELRRCTARPEGCTWSLGEGVTAAVGGGQAPLGWLLSALALSLGSPFWFDLLNRLVKLRASGTPEGGSAAPKKGAAPAGDDASKDGKGAGAGRKGPEGGSPGTTGGTSDTVDLQELRLSDDELRDVQRKLGVDETGRFDAPTRAAIAARRRLLGMPDGVVLDAPLWEAIVERRSPHLQSRPALKRGIRSPAVEPLRTRLAQLLGVPPRAQRDEGGDADAFDAALQAMVRLYQGRAGLEPDGIVGDQTWRMLDIGANLAVDADAWMQLAIAELGLDERKPQDEPRIGAFLAAAGQTGSPRDVPWCGCFVTFVLREAGRLDGFGGSALAVDWQRFGAEPADGAPRYGCVVVLEKQTDASAHHVGFLVGETTAGQVVLGGNQDEQAKVSVSLLTHERWRRLALRMPPPASA